MTRALFICGKARMRSPTAADVARERWGIETDFAGLSNDADEKLSQEQIAWADVVLVMERRQRARLNALFGAALRGRKVVVLDIPDRFGYMDENLVALLEQRLGKHFGPMR
ncbi:MAG TPA: phosphotyrosine protein phosphatase [Rhodobacteraceae bacterium]|nr:phosphotyrosine protein phosphatase [Paracoccaceae bacterium]